MYILRMPLTWTGNNNQQGHQKTLTGGVLEEVLISYVEIRHTLAPMI